MQARSSSPFVFVGSIVVTLGCADDDALRLGTTGDATTGANDSDDSTTEAPGTTTDGPAGTEEDEGTTGDLPGADNGAQAYVDEARAQFPTYLDLHQKVVTRTCTPDPNNCHNNKEYPELDTPLTMLSSFDKECNLAERIFEPQQLYNGCEPRADLVQFVDGSNAGSKPSRVAYIETFLNDDGPTSFEVHVQDPIANPMTDSTVPVTVRFLRPTASGVLTIDDVGQVVHGAGTTYFTVTNAAGLPQSNLDNLQTKILGGDLNRDGVFGADDEDSAMRELAPGNPWQSYLLQRVQGNVPGSPMPLANPPLSAAEIIALGCWIEGADQPDGQSADTVIDYDNCLYAADFGAPPDNSGATLSEHVQPIFDTACAFSGCHGSANPAAGLDLTAGKSRDSLLDTASTQVPMFDLVELGNPTNSYLVKKVRGADDIAEARMPPEDYEALSESQLAAIKLWISYGAPDD